MTGLPTFLLDEDGHFTTEPRGADELGELLAQCEKLWIAAGVPFRDWVEPGLNPAQVRTLYGSVGLEAPDEAVVLYGWQNGLREDIGFIDPSPSFRPTSLEKTLANYVGYKALSATWLKMPGLLMLEGDVRGLGMAGGPTPSDPPLVAEFNELNQPGNWSQLRPSISMCTWAASWIVWIEEERYHFNGRGWIPNGTKRDAVRARGALE